LSPILKKLKTLISNQPEKGERRKKNKAQTAKQQKKKISAAPCSHHFGYLTTLRKNAAIPEECLTCVKMLECRNASG